MKVYLNEHFFKYHSLLEAELIMFEYSEIGNSVTLIIDSKEDYLYHILNKLGDKRSGLGYNYLIYKFVFTDVKNYLSVGCHSDYNKNSYFTNSPTNIQLETIELKKTQNISECGIYFFNSFGAREFQYQSISFEQFTILEENGKLIDRDRETEFTFEQLR